jgi:hypothetical protein
MTWLLLIALTNINVSGPSPDVQRFEYRFDSQSECERAGKAKTANFRPEGPLRHIQYTCSAVNREVK